MSIHRAGQRPVDVADVRETNLAVVLEHVRACAPCSRADIAASTGLHKTTVSSLVAELIQRRMLRETGLTDGRIGRPATLLVADGRGNVGIGIEIGLDHLTAVAIDSGGRRVLTWRRSVATPGRSPRRVIADVAGLARQASERVRRTGGRVVGLTVAVPGPVDSAGVVLSASGLGWTGVPVRATLQQALGRVAYHVGVDSAAILGAIAEHRYGAEAGTAHLVYLLDQPGIGAGVIAGGAPLRGAYGYGGAVGHLPVDPRGPVCACDRTGCLDAVAGLDALLRRAGAGAGRPLLVEVEAEQLALRAEAGEERVRAALAECGTWLGYAVALLVDLLNPAAVLLGGFYAPLARWLLPPLQRRAGALAAAPEASGVRIAASALGYEAVASGGAALALDTTATTDRRIPIPRADSHS